MGFPKGAYKALEKVVGPEFISADQAICVAYSRGGYGRDIFDLARKPPACVILPQSTEEIKAIVRIANRYKIPYIPVSTYFIGFCAPIRPNTMIIHLKRMDKLEIDEKNMSATVQPYVTYSELQIEALKKGLFTCPTMAGAQISVLANHISFAQGQLTHRLGIGSRRILAMEWVLPNGEILITGSAGIPGAGNFWGEGPGPDLRGLVRGYTGNLGGLGIVTQITVKLFPLPMPCVPEPQGITPQTTFAFSPDIFRWYMINYPTPEAAVNAMYEIGKSEIGAVVMRTPSFWRDIRKAASKEEFWQLYEEDKSKFNQARPNIVRVLILGFASEKQTDYEERVLKDIVSETGGILKRVSDFGSADCFQPSYTNCAYRPGGVFISEKLGFDSLDHALTYLKEGMKIKRAFMPPLLDDVEECGWINSYDFGHHAHGEITSYYELSEENSAKVLEFEKQCIMQDLEIKAYIGFQWGPNHDFTGPKMGDYHILLRKIKKALDKNDLSNPGRFIQMDRKKEGKDSYYSKMNPE
jgi:hypothetical protein